MHANHRHDRTLSNTCPTCELRVSTGGRVCPGCEHVLAGDRPESVPLYVVGIGMVLAAGVLGFILDDTQGALVGAGFGAIALALIGWEPIQP